MNDDFRRQREVARIREDIIDAAARAFARHGPKGTTVHEIAQEAGYAPAALYSYFKGKDDIFSGILEGLTLKILATFEVPIPDGVTFAQRLELLFQRQCEVAENNRHAFLVFITAQSVEPARAGSGDHLDGRGFAEYEQRLLTWFDREAGPQDLSKCTSTEAACAFVGLSQAFFRAWLQTSGDRPFSEQAPQIVRLFLYGAA